MVNYILIAVVNNISIENYALVRVQKEVLFGRGNRNFDQNVCQVTMWINKAKEISQLTRLFTHFSRLVHDLSFLLKTLKHLLEIVDTPK